MKLSIIFAALLFGACSQTTEPNENPTWVRVALTTTIPVDTSVSVNGIPTNSPSVSTSPDSLQFTEGFCYVWQDGRVTRVATKRTDSSVTLIYSASKSLYLSRHRDTLRSYPEDFVSLPAVYVKH